ncbi:MAG TPA: 2OG-Fe(II) oxygenase, partial [Trebonia sp.]|nr:2OG-Fe(II) oxygenase [Trebonia sp.]
APGAFSARVSVPARDVRLTVAGAGPISLPVRAPQAKRMIASARPARFGRGEQTLMDLSVRDTWEITPDQVTLTGLDWDAILAEVRDGLGLPPRARLRAEPHALLVYGKGQFFLPHQDSEKDDTMIGTLVVSLPSSHTGGELLIEHNDKTVAYQASATEVSVAAFYADCRHEVKPVRTGSRVTLACNLLLDSDPAGEIPAEPSAEAARYLTEHFTTRVSRWKGDDREPPNRLVYLLDHEYTQRGLSWDRLKGADAERAALLRAAAEDAGCEAILALTEIKETWDTEPGRRGRGVDLTYIITSELTLSWWTGVPGGEPISLYVPDEQVCASTPVGGPEAVRHRVHRIHGELRQHDGPLVPASRGRRMAAAACLRGPGGGIALVGADRVASPAGRRRPGQRASRRGICRAVLGSARS